MARKSRKKNHAVVVEETPQPLYRAGVYCRISSESHEAMEDNSLGNQEKICLAYLENQPDIEYSQTYTDNGKTGMNFDRLGFKRMLDDIQRGFINCVIVKDLSRFGRNFIDTSLYLDRWFPTWGVRFIAVNNDFDTLYARSEESGYDIAIPFYNILSEYYARDVSQKIRAVFHSKMESGTFLPGAIPMGYLPDKENNTYKIDPVGAEAVRYIFQRTAEGTSATQIARELNEKGFPTPFRRKIQLGLITSEEPLKRTEQWRYGSVQFILRNPAYSGKRVHFMREKDPDKIIEVPNAHPALIEPDLYEKAVRIEAGTSLLLKTSKNLPKPRSESIIPSYIPNYKETINGRVYCGICNQILYVEPKSQKFRCYSNYHKSNRKSGASSMAMSARKVTVILMTVLTKQIEATGDMEALIADIERGIKGSGHYKYLIRKKRSLKQRLSSAEGYLSFLPYDLVEGRVSAKEYPVLKEKYQKRIADIKQEQADFAVDFDNCLKPVKLAKEWIENLQRFQKSNTVDEQLLSVMVKKITIYPDRRIDVELTYQDIFQGLTAFANEGGDGDE